MAVSYNEEDGDCYFRISSTFKFDNHYGCYCSYVDADCFPQEQSCRDKLQLIYTFRKEGAFPSFVY